MTETELRTLLARASSSSGLDYHDARRISLGVQGCPLCHWRSRKIRLDAVRRDFATHLRIEHGARD